jgi:hypothetical protein
MVFDLISKVDIFRYMGGGSIVQNLWFSSTHNTMRGREGEARGESRGEKRGEMKRQTRHESRQTRHE